MENNKLTQKTVLVTDGMSDDKFVFRTNAPEEEIEKWLYQYNEGLENNQNVFLDPLKEKYMVELLFDSEMNFRDEFDDLEEEGFDYTYNLGDYREFWEKITSKSVEDSDGLMTDYTMYKKRATGEYAFVFGDSELYTPDNSSFDYECETESQAWEWFNTYTGLKKIETFAEQIESWDKSDFRKSFEVTRTSEAMKEIGVEDRVITLDAVKLSRMLKKHENLTENIIKQLPDVINSPVLILDSKQSDSRIVLSGEVYDADNFPVVVILELEPKGKEGIILDEIKLVSAYGKKNMENLVLTSNILYLTKDNKKINRWTKCTGLQLPFGSSSVDSNYIISNFGEKESDFLKKIQKLEDELSETDDPYRREDIHQLIEELYEIHNENILSDEERTIIEFRAKTEESYHKIDDAEYRDIEEELLEELQRLSNQNDWGVIFKDVVMTGSRARGFEEENSDLDFVAEYECETEYNIKEYVVYNYIKEALQEPYGGTDIKIDINPIRAEETGTLAEYLPKAEEYLQSLKALHLAEDMTLFIYDNDISEYLNEICKGETLTLQEAVYRVRDDIIKNNVAHYIEYFRQAAKEFSFNDEPLPKCLDLEERLKEYFPNRLLVDMDGTLAVFRSVDCLETLYEEGYFLNLEPNTNVVDAIKIIIREHPEMDVFIMSSVLSDSKYALAEKNAWLDKYLPEIDEEHRIFPPCGENKLDYVPDGVRATDCLLDDYTHNLTLWEPPAKGIKLLNGINHTSGTWKGNMIRYDKTANMIAENIVEIVRDKKMVVEDRPQDDEKQLENVSESKLPDDVSEDIAKLSKQADELDTKLNEIQDLISFIGSRYNISLNTTTEPSAVDKTQEESFIPLQPKHKDIKL